MIKTIYRKFRLILSRDLLKQITLVVMDVDGVLTDGNIWIDKNGNHQKKFNVKQAIVCNSGTAALHSLYRSIGV